MAGGTVTIIPEVATIIPGTATITRIPMVITLKRKSPM
jgi:hypothetical protein